MQSSSSRLLGAFSLSLSLAFGGCTANTTQPLAGTDGGGGDGGGSDAAPQASGTSSCAETLTCIVNCPANDDVCANACYDRASQTGQGKLMALVDCINTNKCADATCTKTSCGTELNACLQDAPPQTVDSGIPPTTGSPLPADIVGTWSHISVDWGQTYTLGAAGTYSLVSLYDNAGTCIAIKKLSTTIDGAATVQGDKLTLTPTSGTQLTVDCLNKSTTKPASPVTRQFQWSLSPDKTTLTLTDSTGATNFTRQ